jgi:PAS domain S-box-containing protein
MGGDNGDRLDRTLAVFDARAPGEPLTATEVSAALECTRRTAYDRLQALADRGDLETKKVGARGRVWWRPSPLRRPDGAGADSRSTATGDPVSSTAGTTEAPTPADADEPADTSQQAFESLVDAVTEYAIFTLDPDGRVTSWNQGAARIEGYEADEIVGTHVSTFYPASARAKGVPEQHLREAAATGYVEEEAWQLRKDGSRFRAHVTITALTDAAGDLDGYLKVTRDMTRRYRYEERLARRREELERELDEVFDRIDDGFFTLDESLRFTYCNDRAAALLGYSPAATDADGDEAAGVWGPLVGTPVEEILPPRGDSDIHDCLETAFETQEPTTCEQYDDALDRWLSIIVYPSPTGLSVYLRDVTTQRARERELTQYEAVVETVDDGVYIVDDDSRFQFVNEAHAELTGYDREELLGAHASLVTTDIDLARAERHRADLLAEEGDDRVATVETELITKAGEPVPVETRFALFPIGDDAYGRVGVVRDVTDRKRREAELEARVRQQEAVTDLGRLALESRDLDELMARAADYVAETLGADYCKVLDLDPDDEELLLRQGVGWDEGVVGTATVSAVADDSQAAYTLETEEPVVVEDLGAETRFSGPALLTDHDVTSGISTVIGTFDEPWGILGTHDTAAREFSTHDVNFVQSVAHILADAIDRHRDERAIERQRAQLAALNELRGVIRGVTDAVIAQSTRAEVERVVCERLAAAATYECAWVGRLDRTHDVVEVTAAAGCDDLTGAELSLDGRAAGYADQIEAALRTQTVQVRDGVAPDPTRGRSGSDVTDGDTDADADGAAAPDGDAPTGRRRDDARPDEREDEADEDHDPTVSIAIPIVHEDAVFGVIVVTSTRPDTFAGDERAAIDHVGEVVGHAIASIDRKRALTSDEVIELQFRTTDLPAVLGDASLDGGEIVLERTLATDEDRFLGYGTVTDSAIDALETLAEGAPGWEDLSIERTDRGVCRFELTLSEPPVTSEVAAQGGEVVDARIADGALHLRVYLPPGADIRPIRETVEETYPGIELVGRQQVSRVDPQVDSILSEELTDRQRVALEASYEAGFFEWPRTRSGEAVADSLDISPSTFHQHLRAAERKVFDSLLSSDRQ